MVITMGIGEQFIRETRYIGEPTLSDQIRGIEPPPLERPPIGEIILLPDPDPAAIRKIDLSVAIEERESIRTYNDVSLETGELSYLLWCTAGIKWVFSEMAFRTVPSAGCRHAIDTYLAVRRVKGLSPGLYRYIAMEHGLETIHPGSDLPDEVAAACYDQSCTREAAVIFLWGAETYRMYWRYGERGYRNLFLDAGHIGQNLYLAGLAVDCGICAIGAYEDEILNTLLGLDGDDRFIIYAATVGKKNEENGES